MHQLTLADAQASGAVDEQFCEHPQPAPPLSPAVKDSAANNSAAVKDSVGSMKASTGSPMDSAGPTKDLAGEPVDSAGSVGSRAKDSTKDSAEEDPQPASSSPPPPVAHTAPRAPDLSKLMADHEAKAKREKAEKSRKLANHAAGKQRGVKNGGKVKQKRRSDARRDAPNNAGAGGNGQSVLYLVPPPAAAAAPALQRQPSMPAALMRDIEVKGSSKRRVPESILVKEQFPEIPFLREVRSLNTSKPGFWEKLRRKKRYVVIFFALCVLWGWKEWGGSQK